MRVDSGTNNIDIRKIYGERDKRKRVLSIGDVKFLYDQEEKSVDNIRSLSSGRNWRIRDQV